MNQTQDQNLFHYPVLLKEVLENLDIKSGKVYLDVTFGGGGHARAILETDPTVKVFALDWDKEAVLRADAMKAEFGERFNIVWGSFSQVYKIVKKHKWPKFDGVLADLGTSKFQIFSDSGFSFNSDAFLDMRMSKSHSKITAAEVVNTFDLRDLSDIFFNLGEESFGKKIAQEIITRRSHKRFYHANDLSDLIVKVKGWRQKNAHPATKVFQALRIFVNQELENIHSFLSAVPSLMNKDSRFACISFHSLEDRLIKNFFKTQSDLLKIKILTNKPIVPGDEELQKNRASRSAKLRVGLFV